MQRIIDRALREDLAGQDITTNILVPKGQKSEAVVIAREDAVLSGVRIIPTIFKRLNPNVRIRILAQDGETVKRNGPVVDRKRVV